MQPRIEQRDAASLAAGYAKSHRKLEVLGLSTFGVLSAWLIVRLGLGIAGNEWLVPAAALLGFLSADFISGFVHWACDTWGSVETPVLGRMFIRTFREHHVDQEAITRHDFIEANGDNCLVAVPLLLLTFLVPIVGHEPVGFFTGAYVLFLTFFVFVTSQVHKWAHMKRPPRAIAWMQKYRLILSPAHHAQHHAAPFNRNYCITAGWMNGPLTWIGFFPLLERVITAMTGALPRADDIGKSAAIAVATEEGVLPLEGEAPMPVAEKRVAPSGR